MKVTIYTDGSSRGNPGPGGWGAIITYGNEHVTELGGHEKHTTNNRMELTGAIMGLQAVETVLMSGVDNDEVVHIDVRTDSEYVKKGMTEWIEGWVKKGWKTSTKKDVLNKDLWETLLENSNRLKEKRVSIIWTYVKGHAGIVGNERADAIATAYADNANDLQLYDGAYSTYLYKK